MNRGDKIDFELIKTYLKLKSINGFSDRLFSLLIDRYKTANAIYDKNIDDLISLGISKKLASTLLDIKKIDKKEFDKEIALIKKHDIKIILREDENYPELLKNIYDPPPILYLLGNIENINKPKIAIVGSRKASEWGKKFTLKIAKDLSEAGIDIVSGFASGIDIHAHLGAIRNGSTTCVFGNGLLKIYPPSNKRYLKDILEKGIILSEFPLLEPPNRYNFPKRNRIISGLSLGTLVVEASKKSGSLITAKIAIEQNRELFAVPSFPDTFNSATNYLIKNGAILTENYLDVLENIPNFLNELKVIDKKNMDNIIALKNDVNKKVYDLLLLQPLTSNEIMLKMEIDFMSLMSSLTELELSNIIERGSDGKYYATNLH